MRGATQKLLWGVAIIAALAVGGRADVALGAKPPPVVVGLGDSLSSGEGNPDVPKNGSEPAQWQNRRCDRSANSYEAQVVARLEKRNPRTKVRFVYLACSGATILKGLVGPYAGVHPEQPDLPAQVHEAHTPVGRRKADAVMLSIGVNDVGFSKVASFCAFLYFDYCPNIDYTHNPDMTLAQWLKQQLDALPEKYDKLATALKPLVAAGHVFITEYPDLVSSSSHALCKAISFNPPLEIPERSVDWLYHNFYLPLNAAIRAAAKHHGWRVIDAPPGFKNHGYCNEDGWIVTYQQSQNRQGDTNGTLHPNLRGQTEIADASYPLVSKVLPRRR